MKQQILEETRAVLKVAEEMYDLDLTDGITVLFDLRGRATGQCVSERRAVGKRKVADVTLRFNLAGAKADPDTMLDNTVPHEIAHAICWLQGRPNGHTRAWQRICIALGGTGDRCHKVQLKSVQREWLYLASCGTAVTVTTVMHNRIQRGRYRILRATRGTVAAEHFVGEATA